MTETNGLDIREKGRAADGREIALDRRLFMQLLAFGDCRDTALLTAGLDEHQLPGVLYADINDPRVASAAWTIPCSACSTCTATAFAAALLTHSSSRRSAVAR